MEVENFEIKQIELFDFVDIKTIFEFKINIDKVNYLIKKIKNLIIIYDDEIFKIDKINNLYINLNIKKINEFITILLNTYIDISIKNLNIDDIKYLEAIYKQKLYNTFTIKYFKENICLYTSALNFKYKFDMTHNKQIHFINGYFDFTDGEFKKRTDKMFINKYINKKYKPYIKKDKIISILKQIYPNAEVLEYILYIFGSALTGDTTIDQTILFLIGNGSAGKSFILTLIKNLFTIYFKELSSDTFTKGNNKIDKILCSFNNNSIIKISWINEMDDKKLDINLFKKFCEGSIQFTELYKDGLIDIKHNSKLIFTANTFPNIQIDSGVKRRLLTYYQTSEFTDDANKVDETKNIYLKDKELLNKVLKNDKMINSLYTLLFEYGYRYIKKDKLQIPRQFIDTKDELLHIIDDNQNFIDNFIIITDNDKDRISKTDLFECYKSVYPNKYITERQFFIEIKQKNIKYNSKLRLDGNQGCYYGIKFKDENDNNPLDN